MQQFYKLIIKDKKYSGYKKLASFLFLINAIIFTILALRSISISTKIILFTAAFLLLVYAAYNWHYKRKKEKSYLFVYLVIAIIWVTDTPFWYLAVFFLVMLVLQFRMESDFMISLFEQRVIINGFIKNDYLWKDFNNIILKDDLLTLDFNNDRILQVQPDWNESITGETNKDYPLLEKEFNEFCRQQLKK